LNGHMYMTLPTILLSQGIATAQDNDGEGEIREISNGTMDTCDNNKKQEDGDKNSGKTDNAVRDSNANNSGK